MIFSSDCCRVLFLDGAGAAWLYNFHSGELVQPPQDAATAGTSSLLTAVWDAADPHTLAALDSQGGWFPCAAWPPILACDGALSPPNKPLHCPVFQAP